MPHSPSAAGEDAETRPATDGWTLAARLWGEIRDQERHTLAHRDQGSHLPPTWMSSGRRTKTGGPRCCSMSDEEETSLMPAHGQRHQRTCADSPTVRGNCRRRRHARPRPDLCRPQLVEALHDDQSLAQVANVAHLPGILCCSLAMPDIHFGYGFPIGGVAAFSTDDGVVSPGGVGYDINCGCRLLATDLDSATSEARIRPRWWTSSSAMSRRAWARAGPSPSFTRPELERLLIAGAAWAVERGYGSAEDLAHTEDGGALPGADPAAVSERAYARGQDQVGTLGSGNHFLEIQSGRRGLRPGGGDGLRPARGPGHRHGALRIDAASGTRSARTT